MSRLFRQNAALHAPQRLAYEEWRFSKIVIVKRAETPIEVLRLKTHKTRHYLYAVLGEVQLFFILL